MLIRSERAREGPSEDLVEERGDLEDPHSQRGFQATAAKSIWSIAKSLSPLQRAVLVLRYIDDQSYEQIAQALHRPVETIKVLLHNGKRRFRSELGRVIASRPGAPAACRQRGQQIAAWMSGDLAPIQIADL